MAATTDFVYDDMESEQEFLSGEESEQESDSDIEPFFEDPLVQAIYELDMPNVVEFLPWAQELAQRTNHTCIMDAIVLLGGDSINDDNSPSDPYKPKSSRVHIVFGDLLAEILKVLIEKGGVDVNVVSNGEQDTALTIAARTGCVPLLELLVEHGASLTHVNGNDHAALDLAIIFNHYEATMYLMNVTPRDNGDHAACIAAHVGNTGLLAVILDVVPRVSQEVLDFALMEATVSCKRGCVQLLLSHGANPSCDIGGSTALHEAVERSSNHIVMDMLVTHSAHQTYSAHFDMESPMETNVNSDQRASEVKNRFLISLMAMRNPIKPSRCIMASLDDMVGECDALVKSTHMAHSMFECFAPDHVDTDGDNITFVQHAIEVGDPCLIALALWRLFPVAWHLDHPFIRKARMPWTPSSHMVAFPPVFRQHIALIFLVKTVLCRLQSINSALALPHLPFEMWLHIAGLTPRDMFAIQRCHVTENEIQAMTAFFRS
jgi:hypothetical protein